MKPFKAMVVGVALLAASTHAQSSILTYDFSVTARSGSQTATTAYGSFSFDDANVPVDAVTSGVGLLTHLVFAWKGISYTEATANTGYISRSANGDLDVLFGTNCISLGSCLVNSTVEGWYVRGTAASNLFAYSDGRSIGYGPVTMSFARVPEPATFALLAVALVGLGFTRRKRPQ